MKLGKWNTTGAANLLAFSLFDKDVRTKNDILTFKAGISTLSPILTEPERIVPVITVPWPLMEKQWSMAIRNDPEGSLVGI